MCINVINFNFIILDTRIQQFLLILIKDVKFNLAIQLLKSLLLISTSS